MYRLTQIYGPVCADITIGRSVVDWEDTHNICTANHILQLGARTVRGHAGGSVVRGREYPLLVLSGPDDSWPLCAMGYLIPAIRSNCMDVPLPGVRIPAAQRGHRQS